VNPGILTSGYRAIPMPYRLLGAPVPVPMPDQPTFTPRRLAKLAAWYDASVSSSLFNATTGGSNVAPGDGVARWEDISGNGNHLTQSTANNRPTLNAAQFNGNDALDFDGSNDSMALTSAVPMSSGASIVVVSRKQTNNQGGLYSLTGFISSNHHPFTDGNAYDGFASSARFSFAQAFRSDLYVWSVIAGSVKTVYANNAILDQRAYTPANQNATYPVQLIGTGRGDNTTCFDGWICEVLIFTRGITVAENTSLYTYLRAKWGTT
jgi:hypothetical protein